MASSKPRVYILTGAVAAITATGAWYGAGLKTRQEFKQVFLPSTPLPNALVLMINLGTTNRHRSLNSRQDCQYGDGEIEAIEAKNRNAEQDRSIDWKCYDAATGEDWTWTMRDLICLMIICP